MEKLIEVLVLKNIQEDYAKAYHYIRNSDNTDLRGRIQKLKCKENELQYEILFKRVTTNLRILFVDSDFSKIETRWNEQKEQKDDSVEFLKGDTVIDSNLDRVYLFYVLCDYSESFNSNTDLVNLQYFSLLNLAVSMLSENKELKIFFRPMLKMEKENWKYFDEWYYSASQFLYYEILNNPSTYYAYRSGKYGMSICSLRPYVDGIWRKFLPLMPILSYKDINFWLCSMEDIWKKDVFEKGNEDIFLGRNVWYRLSDGKQESYGKEEKNRYMNRSNLFRILNVCKNYLTKIPEIKGNRRTVGIPTKAEMQSKLDALYSSNAFLKQVGDMPLLGFFIFCAQEYFSRTQPRINYANIVQEKIIEKLSNATQLAEGIMQLVENVVSHAQFHKGYFSLRIHTVVGDERNDEENMLKEDKQLKKNYLFKKYEKYFNDGRKKLLNEGERKYFLEVQVLDFSETGILEHYQENLRNRAKNYYGEMREIPNEALKEIDKVKISHLLSQEKYYNSEYDFLKEKYYLVHHYGLKLFVSLIKTMDGYFKLCSVSKDQNITYDSMEKEQLEKNYIPGTQYHILFPSEYCTEQEDTSLNTDINYNRYLHNNFMIKDAVWNYNRNDFETDILLWMKQGYTWQQAKENSIERIAQDFLKRREDQSDRAGINNIIEIIRFDAREIELNCIEYFCKACVIWALDYFDGRKNEKKEEIIPIAVINCTTEHFIGIVRMFSVFYSKQNSINIMEKIQIYLAGKNIGEEFILTGKSFQDALAAAQKLSFVRGIQYYSILSSLHFTSESIEKDVVDLIPFDMEIKYEDGETPFYKGVLKVLKNNIRDEKFGCRIRDAHMRLGSKIHIKDFYEAELLFHNNYYTSRFAYQILNELEKNQKWDYEKPIIIVGYETYSEMLLTEMVTFIQKKVKSKDIKNDLINYIYYENKSASFRMPDTNIEQWMSANTQFIIIVPINSTLTTHDKLIANLKDFMHDNSTPNVIEKIAIVLIRDSSEKLQNGCSDLEGQFWESVFTPEGELPYIITKQLSGCIKHKIKFLLSLETTWFSPLKCPWCFPKTNGLTEEHPLIETNKASVIPMQKINLKVAGDIESIQDLHISETEEENIDRVTILSNYVIYRHVIRNNNHYMFYFETEKYMKDQRDHIGDWLMKVKEQQFSCKNQALVFDILVAPLHYSNTVFVEEVNMRVFEGASMVLHFDVEKEYRENISTKFSNIKILYNNLKNSGKENCMIRFHYVDDTIISGNTFYRMKSVIRSIFPEEVFSNSICKSIDRGKTQVEVKLFDSVFLLLNRASTLTKYNYIDNTSRYFSYVDLYISSMRNHEDACVLCKYVSDVKKLQKDSAFFDLMKYWGRKIERHEIRPLTDVSNKYDEYDDSERKERAKRRLICSHKAVLWLKMARRVQCENEDEEIIVIRNIIVQHLFYENNKIEFETLISNIKVLSRPFIIFERLTKRAVFSLFIEMFNIILDENPDTLMKKENFYQELGKYNLQINETMKQKEYQCAYELLLTLMKRSAAMGSTYVIRRRNMEKIIAYYQKIKEKNPEVDTEDTFYERYLAIIKKNVGLSSDEMKCVYLEYLLIYGREPEEKQMDLKKDLLEDLFYQNLFIENNRVLIESLKDLKKDTEDTRTLTSESLIQKLNDNYYYLNFRQTLFYYDMVVLDESRKEDYQITKFVKIDDFEAVKAFIGMDCLFDGKYDKEISKRYSKIRKYAKDITRADEVNVYVCVKDITEVKEETIEVYSLTGKDSDDHREKLNIPCKDVRRINMGTYLWIEEQDAYRIIAIAKGEEEGESLLFEFCFKSDRKSVLVSLKLFFVYWNRMLNYIEKDIKNNLINKWLEAVDFIFQISKSRAKDHMDDDILYSQLKELMNKYKDVKNKYTDETAQFLKVIVNMYIARFNTRVLTKERLVYYKGKFFFGEVINNYLKIMLDIIEKKGNKKVVIYVEWDKMQKRTVAYHMNTREDNSRENNSMDIFYEKEYKQMNIIADCKEDGKICCTPSHHHLAIIICECILSAAKHGKACEDDNRVKVWITEEGDDICIKNQIIEGMEEKIQGKIDKAKERKGDGISVVTIYEYFRHFYPDSDREVQYNVENGVFEVKLPIFAERRVK